MYSKKGIHFNINSIESFYSIGNIVYCQGRVYIV